MTDADPAERRRADQFYRGVDKDLKLFGAARLGERNVWVRLSRYAVHSNLLEPELRGVLARVTDLRSWYPAWAERAAYFAGQADEASASGHRASAAEYWLTASALYHVAQINTRPEDPLKAEGARQSAACYRRAAPLFVPPAEAVAIASPVGTLPGYLRRPADVARPPLVVLVNGANSSNEELHAWTDGFLRRGLATLAFDGPGQGELAPHRGGIPLTADGYDAAIAAAVSWAAARDDLAGARIGLWGMSLGGLLVARAAARDERVRAAVSLGGLRSLEAYADLPLPVQEEMRELTGLASFAATEAYVAHAYRADNLGTIRCPFLVVHGVLDDIVSTEDARRLAAAAGERGECWVFEDGVHVCYNLFQALRPRVADWLADRLGA